MISGTCSLTRNGTVIVFLGYRGDERLELNLATNKVKDSDAAGTLWNANVINASEAQSLIDQTEACVKNTPTRIDAQ